MVVGLAGTLVLSNSNIRLMNVLPGCTTLVAWESLPTNDSNALRKHDFRPCHLWMSDCTSLSLSSGRRNSMAHDSTSMPRNVRLTSGPSNFPGGPVYETPQQSSHIFLTLVCVRGPYQPKIVQVVNDEPYPCLLNNPLNGIRNS